MVAEVRSSNLTFFDQDHNLTYLNPALITYIFLSIYLCRLIDPLKWEFKNHCLHFLFLSIQVTNSSLHPSRFNNNCNGNTVKFDAPHSALLPVTSPLFRSKYPSLYLHVTGINMRATEAITYRFHEPMYMPVMISLIY
jgi:hypothetical protein